MDDRTDALDEALTELHFRCVPLTVSTPSTPWRRELSRDAVSLHVVLQGSCHIDVDIPMWIHRFERGEVLLVNRGVGGCLRTTPDSEDRAPEVLSARVDFDAPHGHPLLGALPPLTHAEVGTIPSPRSFGPLMDALLAEFEVRVLGRNEVSRLLCEVLFIQALRLCLRDLDSTDRGWFRALADPVIKGQLAPPPADSAMAGRVIELARAAGRSTRRFGARFTRFAGFTPSDHLQHTRARRAAKLLREGETDLARIAHVTGYRSRQGFCRAFKRELGVSPASYWRSAHRRRFPRQPAGPEKTRWEAEAEYGCTDGSGRCGCDPADSK